MRVLQVRAACFDNTEEYVERLGLTPGQQTDVMRTQTLCLITLMMRFLLVCWPVPKLMRGVI